MPALPDPIEQFLSRHIGSVDQLDLLVLLFNSPQTEWSVAAASQVVHCPADKAQTALDRLAQQGLLAIVSAAPEPRYRYVPRDDPQHQTVAAMIAFYRERPVTVIRRVYEQPTDSVQAFADAFKLGKKE
jgi:hypothetical protein